VRKRRRWPPAPEPAAVVVGKARGLGAQQRAALAATHAFIDAEGVDAYVTGGCLRNALLGRPAHDIDLSVTADPLELGRRLADVLGGAFVTLHEEFSIARIVLRDDEGSHSIDLLPVRGEMDADLAERDFSIDAMAMPLAPFVEGKRKPLIDPCGGKRDLERRLVRATSEDIFRRDPLRLLRAVRLCAELGFSLEEGTAALARRDASLLGQAAPERQRDELLRILDSPRAATSLRLADELGLLEQLLPEITATRGEEQPPEHHWDVFQHSLETVAALDVLLSPAEPADRHWAPLWRYLWAEMKGVPDVERHFGEEVSSGHGRVGVLKLGGILHDIAKPETRTIDDKGRMRFFGHAREGAGRVGPILRRLRFSGAEVRLVETMVREHLRPLQIAKDGPPSRRALFRYFRDCGAAAIDVLFLSLADHLATVGPRLDWGGWRGHVAVIKYILMQRFVDETLTAPPRLVTGHDLMEALGISPGPLVGQLLAAVEEAQGAGEVHSPDEALALARRELERRAATQARGG
jgi:poly(A) polymerase